MASFRQQPGPNAREPWTRRHSPSAKKERSRKHSFRKWLELLQQESWQLELIVSGFSIFLLLQAYSPVKNWITRISLSVTGVYDLGFDIFALILGAAWLFLVSNLLFHVVLRGIWIGAIGLRYISGEIDYGALRFQPRFQRFLEQKVGSYDDYVERLEKACSIVFAYSFLLIFIFLSMVMVIAFFALLALSFGMLANSLLSKEGALYGDIYFFFSMLFFALMIILLIGAVLYAFDFISQGYLKRVRWLTPVYFILYRLFSWVTLSFLYRPVYYNFIDNAYGRRYVLFAVPYLVLLLVVFSGITPNGHPFFPQDDEKGLMKASLYDEARSGQPIAVASIPSKRVEGDFLELFLRYDAQRDAAAMRRLCPAGSELSTTGVAFDAFRRFRIGRSPGAEQENEWQNPGMDSTLQCLGRLYQVYVNDSLLTGLEYEFYRHPNFGEKGLLTLLDVGYLPPGKHELRIWKAARVRFTADSLHYQTAVRIPFWKERD